MQGLIALVFFALYFTWMNKPSKEHKDNRKATKKFDEKLHLNEHNKKNSSQFPGKIDNEVNINKLLKAEEERYYKAKVIGDVGERLVIKELNDISKILGDCQILNNVIVNNHRKAQIDHVIVSEYGIFVIETKHYSGVICGNVNDNYWNASYSGGKNVSFYNPIKQNKVHASSIDVLNTISFDLFLKAREAFFPIVVFTGDAKLNITGYSEQPVIYINQLKSTIARLKKAYYLTSKEIEEVATEIRELEKPVHERLFKKSKNHF